MKLLKIEPQIDSLRALVAANARNEIVLDGCEHPTGKPYTFSGQGSYAWSQQSLESLDGQLLADCPTGQVMVGIHSQHWNEHEDRQSASNVAQLRFDSCLEKWGQELSLTPFPNLTSYFSAPLSIACVEGQKKRHKYTPPPSFHSKP